MEAGPKPPRKSRLRPILLGGISAFIITQIVALSPASLEQPDRSAEISPDTLLEKDQDSNSPLTRGIPKGHVPDYSIDQFDYVSTENSQKQWKLLANRAFMYNTEKLVHAKRITAYLYDTQGQTTVVTGREARYSMDGKDLEIYGDVHSKFPDGFQIQSDYMKYLPTIRKVEIPVTWPVQGTSDEKPGSQKLEFESLGMDFPLGGTDMVLLRAVKVISTKPEAPSDRTVIRSDHCVIQRVRRIAKFTMTRSRPLATRFVEITQPTLFARSRKADLSYGAVSQTLDWLTLREDVFFRETAAPAPSSPSSQPSWVTSASASATDNSSLRYGTGGFAVFDTQRNVIVLKEFPQVYQDKDTVTGDIITVHRDTDIVEAEHSNAFSEGDTQQQKPTQPSKP